MVIGFALQDTLGNLFAGLAIQIEKPFRVGQWVQFGDREGQVQEITWRATKLRTKAGQFLIVPNSVISKEPVLNHSEPTVPTRIDVEIGASYLVPPNDVKRAIQRGDGQLAAGDAGAGAAGGDQGLRRVVGRLPRAVLDRGLRASTAPRATRSAPTSGTPSAATTSRSRGRSRSSTRAPKSRCAASATLPPPPITSPASSLFTTLDAEARGALATSASEHLFGSGEAIVRQDADGDSMFVLLKGSARVVLEPSGQEVAVIPAGGCFGEMSMLTGDRRSATVRAMDDVRGAGDLGARISASSPSRTRACSITSRR